MLCRLMRLTEKRLGVALYLMNAACDILVRPVGSFCVTRVAARCVSLEKLYLTCVVAAIST